MTTREPLAATASAALARSPSAGARRPRRPRPRRAGRFVVACRRPFAPRQHLGAQRRREQLAHPRQHRRDVVVRLRATGDGDSQRPIVGPAQQDRVDEPRDDSPQGGIQERGRDPQRDQDPDLPRIELHELGERVERRPNVAIATNATATIARSASARLRKRSASANG